MRAFLILLLLAGCSAVFDSEDAKIAELERVAYNGRQFDRAGIKIDYVFTGDANKECSMRGVHLGDYLTRGQTIVNSQIGACAVLSDPCLVVLPYSPPKAMVREEQLHCRYGDWHKRKT